MWYDVSFLIYTQLIAWLLVGIGNWSEYTFVWSCEHYGHRELSYYALRYSLLHKCYENLNSVIQKEFSINQKNNLKAMPKALYCEDNMQYQ